MYNGESLDQRNATIRYGASRPIALFPISCMGAYGCSLASASLQPVPPFIYPSSGVIITSVVGSLSKQLPELSVARSNCCSSSSLGLDASIA